MNCITGNISEITDFRENIIMKSRLYLILFLAIICVSGTCKKRFGCYDTMFSFETNIKAYPDYDSLKANDTIWLEYSAPVQLKDTFLDRIIDYSGAENLGTSISFIEMIGGSFGNPGAIEAADSFDIITLIGKSIATPSSHRIKAFSFEEISGNYRFKIGIIPRKKGIFSLAPSDAARVYRANDKCTKASFGITFRNTNQHLYLYEQNRPGYTPSEYEATHMYCFKVI